MEMLMAVWMIGTKTIEQVLATNYPEALQTATANLILLKQQMRSKKKSPQSEKAMIPYILYYVSVPPSMVGMLSQPDVESVVVMMPAL